MFDEKKFLDNNGLLVIKDYIDNKTRKIQSDWDQKDINQDDYIKNKPAVDSNYTPNSSNAQSGVAVAQALTTIFPLILSLKKDSTGNYKIVDSFGKQVLFDEIYAEAQSRPVYCHATDGMSLLPLSILESSMIMFIGMPYGAGQTDYCVIQYDGEYGIISVHQRPLIVPEMSDSLAEETYLGSAPSLQYLEQYVRNNSSPAWVDIHIVGSPLGSIKDSSELDDLQPGHIYRLVVSPNLADTSWAGYGWLFTLYMDSGAHNHGQILIDLDGQILSRYMVTSDWTEWHPIGNGGGTNITVDTELNSESTNPVQNKVINYAIAYINAYINAIIYGYGPGNEDYDIPAISVYMAEHDAMSNVIHETYATKEEVNTIVEETNKYMEGFEQKVNKASTIFDYETTDYDWMYPSVNAVKSYVTSQIGDIETSLENIIDKYGLGGEAV